MSNTATKENIEGRELTPYETEQPIAALLDGYSKDILFRSGSPKNQTQKKTVESMASRAVSSVELWSRGVSFLIWKASVSDDVCEQTISSMGGAADALSCFASMVQPLNDLKHIKALVEERESLGLVRLVNNQTDSSRDTARETAIKANNDVHNEMVIMLSEVEAMASTSMHRVMDGLENENPVSTDTLIGLFSGITRQIEAIQRESDKIRTI